MAMQETPVCSCTVIHEDAVQAVKKQLDLLDGKFRPIDLFMDPVVDDCAAHVSRLIRFFAGK